MYPLHLLAFSQTPDDGGASPKRMWGSLALLLLLVLAVWLVSQTVFFVDETEYVYVTQFGEPVRLYDQPGLAAKWPWQARWRFDRRLQMYEPPGREMLTEDKENLTFEWFICWRIPGEEFLQGASRNENASSTPGAESLETYVRRFLESVGSPQAAENRLDERVQAALAAEIGRTRLENLVSLDPEQLRLEEISRRVTQAIRPVAAEQFGVELVDVRIKRFNYPEAVKPAVYAEIRSERERVAVGYRAEGASEKARIESTADLQRDRLLSLARREATAVRGEGEAKAIEILNAAHGKNEKFYELLKTLDTYKAILDDQTTVVLSADSPLLKLLTEGLPEAVLEEQPPATTTQLRDEETEIPPADTPAEVLP